jgi:hypothetical protein
MERLTSIGFGLAVAGLPDLELPGQPAATRVLRWAWEHGSIDRAAVAHRVGGAGELRLIWPSEGEYLLSSDDDSIACRSWGVSRWDAALSSVMWVAPAALPLFGLEPLHGAALVGRGRGLLLLGESGAGKSTLSRELVGRGLAFYADDVCALDDSLRLWPGPPLQSVDAPRVTDSIVGPYDGKFLVRVPRGDTQPVGAAHTVLLEQAPGMELSARDLTGLEAVTAILGHVRMPDLWPQLRRARQFAAASSLAGRPVCRLTHDHGRHTVEMVADVLMEWLSR